MNILDQDIMYLPGVGPHRKEILGKELNIQSWRDLIEYFPYKYVDRSRIYTIREMTGDMPFVQLKGKILRFEEFELGPRKKRIVAHFSDGTGIVDIVWFNGGKYIYDHYKTGVDYILFGRPTIYAGRYQFAHPDIQPADGLELSSMGMQPYYITTERMKKSGLMSHNVEKITKNLVERIPQGSIAETLPPFITSRLHLMGREEALRKIHYPKDVRDVQNAQARLKFEELFYVQLNILRYASDHRRKYRGCVMRHVGQLFNGFYFNHLPFPLTNAQKRVMHEIRADLVSGLQMNRLLQGDVGSGKTLVALMAMLLAIDNGYQACLMAPTEILAEQHLQTLRGFLGNLPVRVELLTGIVKGKRRKEVLDALLSGQVNILVGTHAVLEDNVQFHRLGMAVIDEQHRFGVLQRKALNSKAGAEAPHTLVMTATPIPRTLALSVYGDLAVSTIRQLPGGRQPVKSVWIGDNRLPKMLRFLESEMAAGRQIYWVCPLIEESENFDAAPLESRFEKLRREFPNRRLAMLHGRMSEKEKNAVMTEFSAGRIDLLASTTVIEVGVDVPNATVMVVENAERFGLSQLHQLRGRVGRGSAKSWCILYADPKNPEAEHRLDQFCALSDGFAIAEADMQLRGPGEFCGVRQHGLTDFRVADLIRDGAVMEVARQEAFALIARGDPYENFPLLMQAVLSRYGRMLDIARTA